MSDQQPDSPAPQHAPDPGSSNGSGESHRLGFGSWWNGIPLYLRILGGLVLGVIAGLLLGKNAEVLGLPASMILRLLAALAPPLILVAVIHALLTARFPPGTALRLGFLLVLNTVVAICIGLLVANVVQPGSHAHLTLHGPAAVKDTKDVLSQFLNNVPDSFLRPLVETDKVIGVILIAIAVGMALRGETGRPREVVERGVSMAFRVLLRILHWIIALVPFGVFGKVASIVGKDGFRPFAALGMFIIAVIAGLALQMAWYLIRIRIGTWVRPVALMRGMRDALVMAFSTASSTASMPVTYECLRRNVGLRERSASLGALVGSNFNNDGTALYEAMAALFVAQMLGMHLSLGQQLIVVVTSVFASVGAAGIPEAGLVTMTLVFKSVGLPPEYIALLVTIDWFLDRCRTAVNVMGDVNVSCMLDGKKREGQPAAGAPAREAATTG